MTMNDSRSKPARQPKRAEWQRPRVRRVRVSAAELTTADFGADIVFS
jgi:hypothetical protein